MLKEDICEVLSAFDSTGFEVLSFSSQYREETNFDLEIDLVISKKLSCSAKITDTSNNK